MIDTEDEIESCPWDFLNFAEPPDPPGDDLDWAETEDTPNTFTTYSFVD